MTILAKPVTVTLVDENPVPMYLRSADGGRFLASIEVHESGDAAFGEFTVHTLLELADRAHGPVAL